jgi:hypothetical protein
MVIGIPVFVKARKDFLAEHPEETFRKVFTHKEIIAVVMMLVLSLIAIVAAALGKISL